MGCRTEVHRWRATPKMFPFYQSVKDYALEVGSSPRVWQAEERHRHKIRVGKSLSFRYFQKTAFKNPHENGDSALCAARLGHENLRNRFHIAIRHAALRKVQRGQPNRTNAPGNESMPKVSSGVIYRMCSGEGLDGG
jgi:hypothetical protein